MKLLNRSLLLAALVTLSGCKDSAPENGGESKPEIAIQQSKQPISSEHTLGMTSEQFRGKFNNQAELVDAYYKLTKFVITPGEENNTFTHLIGQNIGIVGTLNKKSGEIKELLVMVTGTDSKSAKDSLKPIIVILGVAEAANSDALKEQVGKFIPKMVSSAMANIETGRPEEMTIGAVHYIASASAVTGLMFSVSPAK